MLRIFLATLVCALALWGVWWMPLVVGFVALLFGSGLEIVVIGILLDLLYAQPSGYTGVFTLLFTLLYVARAVLRTHFFI